MDELWTDIQKGIFHVLDLQAYDHILLLVLLAVPFLFNKWKRILFLVSVIAAAHLLTAVLAIYDVVSVKKGLLTFVISISILTLAVYNILTSGKRPQTEKFGLVFLIAVFFGLVHGLNAESFLDGLLSNKTDRLITLLMSTIGLWIGEIILAFIVVFIGFLGQTIFRFTTRDWVLVVSGITLGLVLPMVIANWQF